MGRSNRVGGYRGRKTLTDILRYIAVVLAVLVALAVAAVFLLQDYIVYTDQGAELRLPPFFQGEGAGSTLPDPGSVNLTELPEGSGSEEEPGKQEEGMAALQLPLDAVLEGTAVSQLEEAGANALVLEAKDQEGRLIWTSGQELAARAQVNGSPNLAEALGRLKEDGVYTVARVCCFRDNSVPYYRNTLALRRGNGNWRDELGLRWLSPASEDARSYVAALCGELAAMGFDEIVLEQYTFPVKGMVDKITRGANYTPEKLAAGVEAFLLQAEQAVEPYGAMLSLRVEEDTLSEAGGMNAQLLERYAACLWVDQAQASEKLEELLQGGSLSGGDARLVKIGDQLSAGAGQAMAVLNIEKIQ